MTFARQVGFGQRLAGISLLALIVAAPAVSQENRWVQIEAHRDLQTALENAATYDRQIGNISGFQMSSDWYAIAIGPFESDVDAFAVRRQLRAERAIPADAFVSNGANYVAQFFPDGASDLTQPPVPAPAQAEPAPSLAETPLAEAAPAPAPELLPEPEPEPEETLRQAQASEQRLSRDDRVELQAALQWFGFYNLALDGAFGPGTRRSMSAWQEARGLDATGVLTTRQRAQLVAEYEGELAALGMANWRDEDAGIAIDLPLALVRFDRHETPFAHFSEVNGSGMRVLLISQPGNQATLFGLYEIMQTLDIVPLEGQRSRQQSGFVLTGQNDKLRSHTVANLRNGQIKGYTLIWTPERDDQADRILPMMEASFAPFGGTLPESAGQASTVARGDLLAGLTVRRPEFARTGFYVDATGTVLTTSAAVAGCGRVTLDEAYNARVVALDEVLGLALLKPEVPLVPLAFAQFAENASAGVPVTISGFSFGDMLTRPVLTFGRVDADTGLNGETNRLRLSASLKPGDLGGPVFGPTGAVLGLIHDEPAPDGRILPPEISFAVPADAIRGFLRANNVSAGTLRADVTMPPEVLTRVAGDLSVLVSCWR